MTSWCHEFIDENGLHQSLLVKIAMNKEVRDFTISFGNGFHNITDLAVVPLPHFQFLLAVPMEMDIYGGPAVHPQ